MNQNKIDSMEAVGELPDYGNLLLQENGFPHVSQSDVWNEAGTKPDHPCLCETRECEGFGTWFQYWNGIFFGMQCGYKRDAIGNMRVKSLIQHVQWREVQP